MKFRLWSVLLLAAGCSNPHLDINRSVESRKVPVVETSRMTYDLRLGAANDRSDAQLRALDEYFRSIGVAYGDRISVDDPSQLGAAGRRQAIAEVVARYGLLLDEATPVTTGSVPAGSVRVVVARTRASVPACPDWSGSSVYDPDASVSGNYGCATRSNIAAMVADPNDLIVGKSHSGGDGQTGASAIGAYRNPPPKTAPSTLTIPLTTGSPAAKSGN